MSEEQQVMSGSPETTAIEAAPIAAPAVEPVVAPVTEEKSLYTGLTGDLKTVDDLKRYTSHLETMVAARAPAPQTNPSSFLVQPILPQPILNTQESFEDLIYSNPTKAKEILKAEIRQEYEKQRKIEADQGEFWGTFYNQNADLKDLKHIVQSVFERDNAKIGNVQRFPTNKEVSEHLAKEARSIVNLVKEKSGLSETRLDSAPAVTVSSSGGEQFSRPAATPGQPISFIEQLTAAKNKRRKAQIGG